MGDKARGHSMSRVRLSGSLEVLGRLDAWPNGKVGV